MGARFTVSEILAITGGTLIQPGTAAYLAGVNTDSRSCRPGELFIPLKGERHDGHDFIAGALARGAMGVLVENVAQPPSAVKKPLRALGEQRRAPVPPSLPPEVTVIAVSDTLTALGDLAQAWRARFRLPVVAITGSCGKTTTKEMTAAVLSRAFRVHRNELNLNNLIGLPLTVLGLGEVHDAAVVELGMNAFGEILRLTRIANPTIGVLLNVYPAHTEGVGDVAGVARAKGELVEALAKDALLIYNTDDPWLAGLARDFPGRALGFGLKVEADLQARQRLPQGRRGQSAQVHFQGRTWPLVLKTSGLHMLYNALAATAVGLALGLAPEETAAALSEFSPVMRRSQVLTLPSGVHLLNDCYNANPGSMAMALKTLAELRDAGRTAAALGDMLELGESSLECHRELGRQAALTGLDLLVVYGNFRQEVAAGAREAGLGPERIVLVETHGAGAGALKEFLKPGDWLLVKGSRAMRMEQVIEALED
jgi:UDP-N-acetylmuramoyl-tripeptide--D-alanyl-D-alanine ligase